MKHNFKEKLLSIVLAVAMMLGTIVPGNVVKAASNRALQVTTDKTSVKRGETFTVTVKLTGDFTGDYTVSAGQAGLVFDKNQLEVVSTKKGTVLTGAMMKDVNDKWDNGIYATFLYDNDQSSGAGELFTAELKVKDNATGNIAFSFAEEKFNHTDADYNNTKIDMESQGKEVALNIPLEKIELNKTSLTLGKGASEQLTVTYTPSDTTEKKVKWSTKDENVATVSSDGVVTAVGKGSTTITAAVGDKTATCQVKVTNPITGISIPSTLNLKKGQTDTLKVTYSPADGDHGAVTWKSDNEAVAEVNSNGLVTAKMDGTANITATVDGKTATCVVTVQEIKLISISLDQTSMTVNRNKSQKLNVIYNPTTTTDDKSVTWTSSEPGIVTVDGDGNVTGNAIGKAKVTAQVGQHIAECEVTVNAPLEKIEFAESELALIKGQTSDALKTVTYFPNDTTDTKDVQYTSDNTDVVTVDNTGSITAKKAGVANITAAGANDTKAVCKVTVTEIPIEGVVLSHTDAEVEKDTTLQLEAHVYPDNTTDDDKTITWKSKDETIATVDNTGLVTALKGGRTVITATASNGAKAECNILVPIHMEGLEIEQPASTEVLKGKTLSLTAKPVPENTTDSYTVAWSSSDETVATVDKDGMVTGLKEGKTTITAKSGSFEDSIEIMVKEIHMTGIKLSYNVDNLFEGKLLKGQSLKIDVAFLPEDTTDDRTVTWTTSDETVAAVDQNGIVTGLKEGSVTVTAKAGAFEETVELEIKEIPLKSIAFDKVISTMTEGEKAVLNVIYNPENTTDVKDAVWSSSDDKIITVVDGELTAKKAGKAVITAKVGEQSISCEITVKPKEEGVTGGGQNKNDTPNKNEDVKSVKTGDTASAVPGVLAVASLLTIVVVLMRRRVRR